MTTWHVATDIDGTVLESHCNGLMRQKSAHIKVHSLHGTIERKQAFSKQLFTADEPCIMKQYTKNALSHRLP